MKKIYFLILSAFVGFLFMQSCKEDETIDGCEFINYTFYVEFVNSEGNPVVTKAMEPTDFSIKCIKPLQEYKNFWYTTVFQGEDRRYYTRFNHSIEEHLDDNRNFKFEVSCELWKEPVVFDTAWILEEGEDYKETQLKTITVNDVELEATPAEEYAKEDRNPLFTHQPTIRLVRVVVDKQP